MATFSDDELDRYARHIIMREIGGPGQRRLKAARVLVVGAGGLGSPAILYLAASGVGHLGIVDDDEVDLSNLQRQVIHSTAKIGQAKAESAAERARGINPDIEVTPITARITPENAEEIIGAYDLILDGTDNFDTRYLLNETCVRLGRTLIAAAMTQWEGQISVYKPAEGGPCYACVFPRRPAPGLVPTCAEAGVLGPLGGIIGSLVAAETVKDITKAGRTLTGRMLIFDAMEAESRAFEIVKNPDCPVCGD